MNIAALFQINRKEDRRVLKLQLDAFGNRIAARALVSTLWAFLVSLFQSDGLPIFGHQRLSVALIVPLGVFATMSLSVWLTRRYQQNVTADSSYDVLETWLHRFVASQTVSSAVWGLLPLLMWEPNNALNHLTLAASIFCALSVIIITRASHLAIFIASLVPATFFSTIIFLYGGTAIDLAIGTGMPFYCFLLFLEGQALDHRLTEELRYRFRVADLAHEVEEARDEALRKRFEAETASLSKTAFLANMSHELRTPLNAILGFSEIIAQQSFGPASPRYRDYAGDIHASGAHLLSLINDLLDVSKIEAGKMEIRPESLDTRRIFENALKLVTIKARERRQELTVTIDPATPPLYADERAIKQILLNLVSNSVKFTPEGGRIAVKASASADGAFQIIVEDTGPGVPADKLDKIFSPFNQVDNRYDRQAGGTGLGLALVRGLVELHGGRTWMESELGKGSRVYVVLPAGRVETRAPVAAVAFR